MKVNIIHRESDELFPDMNIIVLDVKFENERLRSQIVVTRDVFVNKNHSVLGELRRRLVESICPPIKQEIEKQITESMFHPLHEALERIKK